MGLFQLIKLGGITVFALITLSIFSIAIIIERAIFYINCRKISREEFMKFINNEISKGNSTKALEFCTNLTTPCAKVVEAGLRFKTRSKEIIENSMDRQITIETMRLEKRTAIVGTIGSTAVYIGLFGTVLGIIKAFQDIATKGAGGTQVVINGISEALICTAVGLCVAVPAVIAYNYFIKCIEDIIKDMELCASETLDLIVVNK